MSNGMWVGVDLGETTFVAAVTRPGVQPKQWADLPWKSFEMTKDGVHAFCKWVAKQGEKTPVAGLCAEALLPLGWTWMELLNGRLERVCLVNPRFPKDYKRAVGVTEKTDRVDACMLAFYGLHMSPRTTPLPSKIQRQLHMLSRLHEATKTQLQAAKNRLRNLSLPPVVQLAEDRILKEQAELVELLEQQMLELVQSDAAMSKDCKRLQTIPGIAQLTALRVLAELGDLRQYGRTELVALAGLCPRQFSSGTSVRRPPRLPGSGNAHLRKALFMPGMTAKQYCPTFHDFTDRLGEKGLAKKAVICAVMRKLLLLMRALLRAERDYDPKYKGEPKAA